jgi:protoheme IX farnesyltransferase
MKAAVLPEQAVVEGGVFPPCDALATLTPGRLADYLTLTKPRVAVLVLFTVAIGALLAGGSELPLATTFHAVLGTALVASGASALNQWLERRRDACMRRTENRPLPAGRLLPLEVFLFGSALGLGGMVYLALTLKTPWAALLAGFTFVCYVAVYTPLKAITPLNTLVGAVPGAMPPVIGWCAVRGGIDREALALFVVVFLWQVPHFLAIAWIYRDQYAQAGYKMLPVLDLSGELTAGHMVSWCLALIPASLVPVLLGQASVLYASGAVLLGLLFLASALSFRNTPGIGPARRVLRASLVYLPGLLALLLLDHLIPWLFLAN